MVKGLDTFRKYFRDYADNYIIIGGTACNELIEDVGLKPRTTQDIDAILIVEALRDGFVTRFWEFIREGNYELWETMSGKMTTIITIMLHLIRWCWMIYASLTGMPLLYSKR